MEQVTKSFDYAAYSYTNSKCPNYFHSCMHDLIKFNVSSTILIVQEEFDYHKVNALKISIVYFY